MCKSSRCAFGVSCRIFSKNTGLHLSNTHCPHSTLSPHSKPAVRSPSSALKLPKSPRCAACPDVSPSCRLRETILSESGELERSCRGFAGSAEFCHRGFPPALSCSLTSEHKQEALHRADTGLQLCMQGHSLRIEWLDCSQSHTGSLCPFVS